MNIRSLDGISWSESLEDFKPNYSAVKCYSVLQFYALSGRKSNISKENLTPIEDLKYCVLASDKKYYFHAFRGYPLDVLYFKQRGLEWNSFDSELNNLHNYILDGNVWLLFTADQSADMTSMLQRLYKSHFRGEGKVPYHTWIKLMHEYLTLEEFRDKQPNAVGFKTAVKMAEQRINELWKTCFKN